MSEKKRKQQAKAKNATALEHPKAIFLISFSSSNNDIETELDHGATAEEHETQFQSKQIMQERKHARPQCKLPAI